MTKAERILRYIAEAPEGRTMTEVQTFIILMNGIPGAIDERTGLRKREHRGWYCTNLYENRRYGSGPGDSKVGLFLKYCTKLPTGRWIVTEPIVGPWYTMPVKTKSYIANMNRRKGEHAARVETYPICEGCHKPRYPGIRFAKDGKACIVTSSSSGYEIDCQDRVWCNPYPGASIPTDLKRDEIYSAENAFRAVFNTWDLRSQAMKDFVYSRAEKPKLGN